MWLANSEAGTALTKQLLGQAGNPIRWGVPLARPRATWFSGSHFWGGRGTWDTWVPRGPFLETS
jgi:hypothetical protein